MWISKKEWEKMEERVYNLECGKHKHDPAAHEEPRMRVASALAPSIWVRFPTSVPIGDVVRAILDYLGLKIETVQASEERVVLSPAAPAAKRKV